MAHTLIEHLRDRHLLLVVDNCEHVIEDCAALVDAILRSCPSITVLATSREALRVSGETVWRLAPLAVPDPAARIDLDELARCEAVGLYLDRARLAAPGFEMSAENAPAVAELCRRLDGIPLAIELAAARAGLMSPGQILNRMQDRFGLLTGGNRAGPARHRTLQSAIDWSYDLLSDEERRLFWGLSVFTGSFSLEAVEQVCTGDDLEITAITGLLGSLVDKSLVIAAGEVSAPIRFGMLETMQRYGYERLSESGAAERLNRRHCEFFMSLAEEASPNLLGRDQRAWHQRLAHDISNLRSALEWSAGHEPEANLRLNNALTDFWYIHGLVQEGDVWFKRGVAGYAVRNQLRAEALGQGGKISYWRDDISSASARLHEALVGEVAEWQEDFDRAHRYFDEGMAMSSEAGDERSIAEIFRHLGRMAMKEGEHDRARVYLQESLSYFERIGDQRTLSWALGYLGLNAIDSGNFNAARHYLERALTVARALDLTIPAATMIMYFATLAAAQLHPVRALQLAGASESLAESAGAAPIRLTRPIVERWLDRSRKELGPERSAALWAEGRAMSRESATEYALKG